jgi:hypothetical protein
LKSHFYEEPESAFWFSGKRKSKCILRSWSITSLSLSLSVSLRTSEMDTVAQLISC